MKVLNIGQINHRRIFFLRLPACSFHQEVQQIWQETIHEGHSVPQSNNAHPFGILPTMYGTKCHENSFEIVL